MTPTMRAGRAGRAGVTALATTLVLALGGCSASDDGASEEEAGALAAATAYVEAIAAVDVETVDAMTDPAAFEDASGPDDDVDIRSALPDAADPISDPWVSVAGPTYESRGDRPEYVIDVSYDLKDLTGGGSIVVTLKDDADPDDVDGWVVTDPLIVRGETFSELPAARIGPVELTYDSTRHEGVWGYPGGYLLTPPEPTPRVEPLWLPVGVADAPPWDDSLPMLEASPPEER